MGFGCLFNVFHKPVKETTFSSKLRKVFSLQMYAIIAYLVSEKMNNTTTQSWFVHASAISLSFTNNRTA